MVKECFYTQSYHGWWIHVHQEREPGTLFCQAYADDVDYQYEDEVVEENIIANDYEFDEYGNPE